MRHSTGEELRYVEFCRTVRRTKCKAFAFR
jgi:hypothetical protein